MSDKSPIKKQVQELFEKYKWPFYNPRGATYIFPTCRIEAGVGRSQYTGCLKILDHNRAAIFISGNGFESAPDAEGTWSEIVQYLAGWLKGKN